MSETLGANIEQLQTLAERFSQSAENLRTIRSTLTAGVINNTGWRGSDADSLRSSWDGQQMAIMLAANTLDRGSRDLLEQARQQEQTSDSGSGAIGGFDGTPAGTAKSADDGGGILDAIVDSLSAAGGFAAAGYGAYQFLKNSEAFINSKRILDLAQGLRNVSWADDMLNATSKFSKFSRFAGPLLAPFSIAGGIHDMFDPAHEGALGVGDRVAGGLSVIGGGGTLLMAAGLLGPVGVGIVVGAGLAAGAWALGTYVYDNWDNIAEFTGNAVDAVRDFGGDAVEGAGDLADSVTEGIGDFVDDPIGSIGGLFD